MDKLSVIIPTIYKKTKVLYKLIDFLSKENVVDEIIVISNAPCTMEFPTTEKLSVWEPKENAYVYPAWNIGIKLSRNNNFLIINDDILICKDCCEMVITSKVFNDESTGLIGINVASMNKFDKNLTDDIEIPEKKGDLIFTPLDKYEKTDDWGSAIFGKKENYYTIPNCFKILFGDNYLLYQNIMNNKINYQISGVEFNHIHSSTSSSGMYPEIIDKDFYAWAFYKVNYIKKNCQS